MCKFVGFPDGTVVKSLPASVGDTRDVGLIPGSRSFPAGGNGNSLQYSYLENSTDRGAQRVVVHGVAKNQTQLSEHACTHMYMCRGVCVYVWVRVSYAGCNFQN